MELGKRNYKVLRTRELKKEEVNKVNSLLIKLRYSLVKNMRKESKDIIKSLNDIYKVKIIFKNKPKSNFRNNKPKEKVKHERKNNNYRKKKRRFR